jgi:hypothetical protein
MNKEQMYGVKMNREQYEFSNMFWEDEDYDINLGIPKYYIVNNDDDMVFHLLNNNEIRDFMIIKARENPKVMKDIRYKKIMRILKIK